MTFLLNICVSLYPHDISPWLAMILRQNGCDQMGFYGKQPLTRQIKEKQLVGGFSPSPLKNDGLRQLG